MISSQGTWKLEEQSPQQEYKDMRFEQKEKQDSPQKEKQQQQQPLWLYTIKKDT